MKAHIHPDLDYPNMYRVRWPDGSWSDMVNLARAKDAISVRETLEANARKKSSLGHATRPTASAGLQ